MGACVAVAATFNWYWIVNEIERAEFKPLLVNPSKSRLMMGMINKTDKLDVHWLNLLYVDRGLVKGCSISGANADPV